MACKSNLGTLMISPNPDETAKKYPLTLAGVILFIPLFMLLLVRLFGQSVSFGDPIQSFVWSSTSLAIMCLVLASVNKCS